MSSQPRLKLALIGLGRLGSIRARILAFQEPRIEFVAACDSKPGSDQWVKDNLPPSVRYYADPEECMAQSGAEAVLISTGTATHPPLIITALDNNLHVMCEKPISVDNDATLEVLAKAASKPHLKFLVPFCRRYDESVAAAKELCVSGGLGDVHAVESACMDKQDPSGFFVAFSAQSGGIFVDMAVHDIDIGRWFLEPGVGIDNPKKQVARVSAVGQRAVYDKLSDHDDFDNAWGLVEFTNGKVLTTHVGRTLTNGYEGATRVYGTKGSSTVNADSHLNRVQIHDEHGIRSVTVPDVYKLYGNSFINDLAEFADAVLDGKPLRCRPEDAYEAFKIATALQFAVRNRCIVYFDDDGMPILRA